MSPEEQDFQLDDKFHDECGLFGVWNHVEASNVVYLGLYALQHRGQESAGIAATDGHAFHVEKAMGWVADVFSPERLRRLPGRRAMGHVRYSTAGTSSLRNAQPITGTTAHGPVAIAHNGNLVNADELRRGLEADGAVFQSSSDTEVILHLLARAEGGTLVDQLARALNQVKGAYTLLLLTPDSIIAVRDPSGFRPMTLGKLEDSWVLASETCALDLMEAKIVRDVEPGEIVLVDDAGVGAALGFAEEAGLPYDSGLVRNDYVGRTFIEPKQGIRHFGVKVKLNPNREVLAGKRVVVVDDSIVRGTTSRKIVKMLRAAGAREVHMRISSPPIQWPCYYGIDTPTRKELIGSSHTVEEIRRYIGADSIGYLSLEGMLKATGSDPAHFCHACFTGQYRIGFDAGDVAQLKLFDS